MEKLLKICKKDLLNPYATGYTFWCGRIFEHAKSIAMYVVPLRYFFKIKIKFFGEKMSLRYSGYIEHI